MLNYFVPSGGSKWAIEAPYLLSAAQELGVSIERTAMAYAYGDMSTNLIQPFWAIPLLAVAKLEFRDIVGACDIDTVDNTNAEVREIVILLATDADDIVTPRMHFVIRSLHLSCQQQPLYYSRSSPGRTKCETERHIHFAVEGDRKTVEAG